MIAIFHMAPQIDVSRALGNYSVRAGAKSFGKNLVADGSDRRAVVPRRRQRAQADRPAHRHRRGETGRPAPALAPGRPGYEAADGI